MGHINATHATIYFDVLKFQILRYGFCYFCIGRSSILTNKQHEGKKQKGLKLKAKHFRHPQKSHHGKTIRGFISLEVFSQAI